MPSVQYNYYFYKELMMMDCHESNWGPLLSDATTLPTKCATAARHL